MSSSCPESWERRTHSRSLVNHSVKCSEVFIGFTGHEEQMYVRRWVAEGRKSGERDAAGEGKEEGTRIITKHNVKTKY